MPGDRHADHRSFQRALVNSVGRGRGVGRPENMEGKAQGSGGASLGVHNQSGEWVNSMGGNQVLRPPAPAQRLRRPRAWRRSDFCSSSAASSCSAPPGSTSTSRRTASPRPRPSSSPDTPPLPQGSSRDHSQPLRPGLRGQVRWCSIGSRSRLDPERRRRPAIDEYQRPGVLGCRHPPRESPTWKRRRGSLPIPPASPSTAHGGRYARRPTQPGPIADGSSSASTSSPTRALAAVGAAPPKPPPHGRPRRPAGSFGALLPSLDVGSMAVADTPRPRRHDHGRLPLSVRRGRLGWGATRVSCPTGTPSPGRLHVQHCAEPTPRSFLGARSAEPPRRGRRAEGSL